MGAGISQSAIRSRRYRTAKRIQRDLAALGVASEARVGIVRPATSDAFRPVTWRAGLSVSGPASNGGRFGYTYIDLFDVRPDGKLRFVQSYSDYAYAHNRVGTYSEGLLVIAAMDGSEK